MSRSAPSLVLAQDLPAEIVGGAALVAPLCGWLEGVDQGRLELTVDGGPAVVARLDEPVPERLWPGHAPDRPCRGVAAEVLLPAAGPGHAHQVCARWLASGGGTVAVFERTVPRVAPATATSATRPTIAICMAVYDPEPVAFERQVASIRAQRRGDWICIVNDDGSSEAGRQTIARVVGDDPRFQVFCNPANQGFYRNFETTLARVPDGIEFIALADQDDLWYADKLDALVDALSGEAWLAYSDMRIVDADGGEVSPSYWGYRLNRFDDLDLMLVANTVTGAACMMRRSLFDVLLPFPPRVGEAFHDHWIACAALAGGSIAYVDRPLYDYVQHGASIIGHCGFTGAARAPSSSARGLRRLDPRRLRSLAARFVGAGQAVYWHECRRIETLCRNLLARDAVLPSRRAALARYGRGLGSAWSLLWLNLRTRRSARYTNNAERRLAHGYLVHAMLRRFRRAPIPSR